MNTRPFWAIFCALAATLPGLQAQSRDDLLRSSSQARLESQMGPGPGVGPDLRTYERQQEEMALERARHFRGIMKQATAGLPGAQSDSSSSSFGANSLRRRKDPPSTGITDGTWQTERLKKMRPIPTYEPVRERRGILESVGAGLDSVMTNDSYVERRRAGLIDDDAGPLKRLGDAASGLGERGLASNMTQGVANVASAVLPGGNADENAAESEMRSRLTQANPGANSSNTLENVAPVGRDEPGRIGKLIGSTRRDQSPPVEMDVAIDSGVEETRSIGSDSKRDFSLPSLPSLPSFRSNEAPTQGFAEMEPESDNRLKRFRGGTREIEVPDAPLASNPSIYVVSASGGAEFHPFGDALAAGQTAIPAGVVVTMDKAGDEWSSVKLSSGKSGLMRTKDLRRARESEMGSAPLPTIERRSPPSLFGSGGSRTESSDTTGRTPFVAPPTNVPLPKLPRNPGKMDLPLGHGLLPPLPNEG